MIICWGEMTKVSRRRWVGDYCPVCRGLRACKAYEVRVVPHLMFMPAGSGRPVMWLARCSACKTRLSRPPKFFQKGTKRLDPVELVERTHPFSPREIEYLLEREAAVEAGVADEATRLASALDALAQLGFEIDRRMKRGVHAAIGAVLKLVIVLGGVAAVAGFVNGHWIGWIAAALVVLATCGLIYQAVWANRRARERVFARFVPMACGADGHRPEFLGEVLRRFNVDGADWANKLDPVRVAACVEFKAQYEAATKAPPLSAAA